jgi:ankyrin repeat protein
MEPQHEPSIQRLVCPDLPVRSALGQSLRQEGYGADGDFVDKDEALAWAIKMEKIELVQAIVEDGVNINLGKGQYQNAPLHVATDAGSCEIISILKDANADLEGRNVNGFTPLHLAAQSGRFEVAKLLCDLGADTKCRCYSGGTPIHYAARRGHYEIIQLLADRNIEVDICDDNWMTPLSLASAYGKIIAVHLLVKLGADVNLEDKNGHTALDHAASNDHTSIV